MTKFSQFAIQPKETHTEGYKHLGIGLREYARSFHQRAGTLSKDIESQIARLEPGSLVRLAHQPNALAYGRLLFQFPALDLLAQQVPHATPIYTFIDYDVISSRRFKRTHLPDGRTAKGLRSLGLSDRLSRPRTLVANRAPVPPKSWEDQIRATLHEVNSHYSELGCYDEDRASSLIDDFRFAYREGRSLADANAIFLSRIVNLRLDLSIIFIPSSAMWSLVSPRSVFQALDQWPRFCEEIRVATLGLRSAGIDIDLGSVWTDPTLLPMWLICDCGSRVAISFEHYGKEVKGYGQCPHCHLHTDIRLNSDSSKTSEELQERFIPRIAWHNYFNASCFGYSNGTSHAGSADHVIVHAIALSRLGHPILPQLLWEPEGYFGTPIEELFASNTAARTLPGLGPAVDAIRECMASCMYYLVHYEGRHLANLIKQHLALEAAGTPFRLTRCGG